MTVTKGKVAALLAGVGLGSAGFAVAANGPVQAIVLKNQQGATWGGITCTAYAGSTPADSNLVCVRNDLKGYGVVVSQSAVVVAKRVKVGSTYKIKTVFKSKNR